MTKSARSLCVTLSTWSGPPREPQQSLFWENILDSLHSSFRGRQNTAGAGTDGWWLMALDRKENFALTIKSVAFDHIMLKTCIEDLASVNVSALYLIPSVLSDRAQRVEKGTCCSSPIPVSCRVFSQSFVFSYFLLIMYIRPVRETVSATNIHVTHMQLPISFSRSHCLEEISRRMKNSWLKLFLLIPSLTTI